MASHQRTPSPGGTDEPPSYLAGTEWQALFPQGTQVVALPGWRNARLLIPAATFAQRWIGSAFFPAFRPRARLYRGLLRIKALTGVGTAQVEYPHASPSLNDYLAHVLPEARVQAVMVGMPNRAQKLIVQLADREGAVAGYLKCAFKPFARERLLHEYEILRELPKGVGPRPLHFGSVGGMDAMLLEPVLGQWLRPSIPPPPQLRHLAASLFTTTSYAVESHPWVQRESESLPEAREILAPLADREWAAVWQHGDLAPWNLCRRVDGGLTAIDWEYGCRDGFPGIDLAQYILQMMVLIFHWSPARARAYASQYLVASELGISMAQATSIVRLAAYSAYYNTLADGHPASDPVQEWRRAVWMEVV